MSSLLLKVAINAAALLAAANFIPEFRLTFVKDKPEDWIKVLLIALVFAVVNSYLKPILKLLTLPISWLAMGLVAVGINVLLLLGTAWAIGQVKVLNIGFSVGGFPPHWGYEAIGVAVVASIVISVVATVLEVLLLPRKAMGL